MSQNLYPQVPPQYSDPEVDRVISLGSFNVTIPGGWFLKTETDSNQRVVTVINNSRGIGILKFMSLTIPQVISQKILRNMTNVDASISLDWQIWGDLNGYKYDYTENGKFYRQWWLMNQNELLFFVYSSDSQDESEKTITNGIIESLSIVN